MIVTDKFRKYAGRPLFSLIFISTLLVTGGCQQSKPVNKKTLPEATTSYVPPPVMTPAAATPDPQRAEAGVEGSASNCQRELVALSKIDQRLYAQKKAAFNELLSSASVYTAVREDITLQTKDTMDAFYKFKTQKICSDIEQTVRQALINRVENSN